MLRKNLILTVRAVMLIAIIFSLELHAQIPPESLLIQFSGPDVEILTYYNYETGEFSDNVAQNIKGYFNWAKDNGENWFVTEAIYIGEPSPPWDTAYIGFNSPTLIANGYTLADTILEMVIREAHARGHKIDVNIEHLAHATFHDLPHCPWLDTLTAAEIGSVIVDLHNIGVDGIYEEAFPDEYVQAMHNRTRALNMEYYHCFDDPGGRADVWVSEDYHFYPRSQVELESLITMQIAGNSIGNLTVMFGQAQVIGIPTIVGVAGNWGLRPGMQNNIATYRMIQFDPIGFAYWCADSADEAWVDSINTELKLPEMVRGFYSEFGKSYAERPRANLIIDNPADTLLIEDMWLECEILNVMDFITSSLSAAGYDIYVTYNAPYSGDIDAYFIYTLGDWTDIADVFEISGGYDDISADLATLFSSGKKVVLLTICGIPKDGNWSVVREALGIPVAQDFTTVYDIANPFPDTVLYQGKTYRFAGIDFWEWGYALDLISPDDINATTLVSDTIMGENTVLLLKNGDKYFVNASAVHLEASNIIANLTAPDTSNKPFNEPNFAYMSRGEMSAILAVENTNVNINLPIPDGIVKVVELDSTGNEVFRDNNYAFSNPFTYDLNKWSLLVVDGSPLGIEEDFRFQISDYKVYPNPFSTKTVIQYAVSSKQYEENCKELTTVYSLLPTICIYDLSGRLIRTIPITDYLSPITEVSWDGRDINGKEVQSGVYFLRVGGCKPVKVVKLR